MSASSIPAGLPKSARLNARVELQSVRLVEARLDISPKPFDGEADLDVRVKTGVERRDDELLVLVGVWLRLLPVVEEDGDAHDEPESILSVIAEHVATYTLPKSFEADDEELEAFVEQSGVLGIWPFARETIQSLAGKAGFPEVTLPIRKAMLDRQPPLGGKVETTTSKKASAKKASAKKASAKKARRQPSGRNRRS